MLELLAVHPVARLSKVKIDERTLFLSAALTQQMIY
jgi:hypothetical protein